MSIVVHPKFEYLREDDPDYVILKEYKTAHDINHDCNDPDVVVLMRRARAAERATLVGWVKQRDEG